MVTAIETKQQADQRAEEEVDQSENRAGLDPEFDNEVCKHVRDRVSAYRERVLPLYKRWRLTNFLLSGNTIDQAGPMEVHIPELYKIVETIVPRVEEIILGQNMWFRVRPRREIDRMEVETAAAFMDWQFDQAGLANLIQPALRDLLVTQVAVFRIGWDRMIEKRPHRIREVVNGKRQSRREMRWKKVYDGPTLELVDPFDLIIDLKCTDPQKARYVGHVSWYTFDELKQFEAMGFIRNVDKLKEEEKEDGPSESSFDRTHDPYKWTRSPTDRYSRDRIGKEQQVEGEQKLYEVCTICTKYQFSDGEPYEEAVLVVANGRICLAAMPNPYDFKMRPYAIARATRAGHDFFGTGILDNAVRLNQHLDRAHAIGIRTFDIGGMPLVFTDPNVDTADNLYNIRPGSVLPYGRVTMTTVPEGVLRNMPLMLGSLGRQIEETTGTFKIQMGQEGGSDTLGQSTIALQEGNRRLRGLVRNFVQLLNQSFKIVWKLNAQFADAEDAFPILGKRADFLRKQHATVSPDTFLEDADFEFVGLDNLHTYGLRATMIQQVVSSAMPLIAQNAGRVDQLGLLHELFSLLVGSDFADRIVRLPDRPELRMAQEEENRLMLMGTRIEVGKDDPHERHLRAMMPDLQRLRNDENADPDVLAAFEEHAAGHVAGLRRQQEQQMIQDRERAAAGAAQLPPEAGGTPTRRAPVAGGLSAAMATPGPPDASRMPRGGRESHPIFQTQNQPER